MSGGVSTCAHGAGLQCVCSQESLRSRQDAAASGMRVCPGKFMTVMTPGEANGRSVLVRHLFYGWEHVSDKNGYSVLSKSRMNVRPTAAVGMAVVSQCRRGLPRCQQGGAQACRACRPEEQPHGLGAASRPRSCRPVTRPHASPCQSCRPSLPQKCSHVSQLCGYAQELLSYFGGPPAPRHRRPH